MPAHPKKILFVITKSNWGGAQSYVYTLATRFSEQGNDVAVAVGGTGLPGASTGVLAERLSAAGVRVHHIRAMARDISALRELHALRELCDVIRAERPDAIHLNSSKAGVLGAFAARLCGVRHIIFTAHGWPYRERRAFMMRALLWIASWLTVAWSTATIAVSQRDFKDAPIFFSRRTLHLIHNGMDSFAVKGRQEARSVLAKDSDPYWFLMSAELHPNKAIDIAIDAFTKHAKDTQGTALVVIGEGQERARLEARIKASSAGERMHLAGFIQNARAYLAAGDCFLLPSRKEGFPLVLLEAGLANVPVIASRTGGIPELIENGTTGLLIKPADRDELASAMDRVHGDAASAAQLAKALHEKIVKDFSESQMIEKTFALY